MGFSDCCRAGFGVPSWLLLMTLIWPVQEVRAAELLAPAISIVAIHSPTWAEGGPRLMCRVRVNNPNAESLFVSGADIKLKLAGSPAAKGWLARKVEIPANAAGEVNVTVNVFSSAAFSWMPMFLGSGDFWVPFEVDGVVRVDNRSLGTVPFRETGDVGMTKGRIQIRPGR